MSAISSSSIIRKGLNAIILAGALSAAVVASASGAQAKPMWPDHFWAPGLGLGVGLLAATAVSTSYGPECQWVRQYDIDGNYLGRVRVCE